MTARRLWGKTLGTMIVLGMAFPLVAWSQEPEPAPCTQFAQALLARMKDHQGVAFKAGSTDQIDQAALATARPARVEPVTIGSESDGSDVEAFCSALVQQFQNAAGEPALLEVASPPPASQGAEGFDPAEVVHKVEAEYTAEAREERIQGVVILRLQIDEAGGVTDAEVLKGLPLGLSGAAVAAARQWRFNPAKRDGEPVASQRNVVVEFRL